MFAASYTANAADKHFARAFLTYKLIVAATGTTGGAGDIDAQTDRQVTLRTLTAQLTKARSEGRKVGKLSAKTWEQWRGAGWLKLFDAR